MKNILITLQIAVSVLLITFILLQQRGTGLGTLFGQSGSFYFQRRGLEKFIFIFSSILTVFFIILSLAMLIVSK
ncbi:MAG: preprotein translocase subunit SecG [Minisyncoccia bacterium]